MAVSKYAFYHIRISFMILAEALPLPRLHFVIHTGLRKEQSCSLQLRVFILANLFTAARKVS